MGAFKTREEPVEVCGAKMYLNSAALTNGSFADVVGRLKDDLQAYRLELGPLAECRK